MVGLSYYFKVAIALSALVFLIEHILSVMHPHLETLAECVYNAGADAVKSAGNLISSAAEFTPGMKNRKYYLNGCYSHFWMDSRGNTATVIRNLDSVIFTYFNLYVSAVTGERLIDAVVYYFIYKMMKTVFPG